MKKIFLAVAGMLLMPFSVYAESSNCNCPTTATQQNPIIYSSLVRLSEVLPDPDGENKEFIEIENTTTDPVSLASWILADASNKKFSIASLTVPAKGFATIDKSVSGISLNNTGGETVTLISPDGIVQDTLTYTGTAKQNWAYARTTTGWSWTTTPTPCKPNIITLPNTAPTITITVPKNIRAQTDANFSAEVKDADGDDVEVMWVFSDGQKKSGTDITLQFSKTGAQTVTVTARDERGAKTEKSATFSVAPFDPAENVLLNELYPKPKSGEVEWIEIANTNDRSVALAGWQLTDGVTTYTFPEDAQISASGFLAIDKTDTSISLNDSGDTATLIKPDGATADTITYDKATQGKSYAKLSSGWTWGDPTKNAANESTLPKVLGETVFASPKNPDSGQGSAQTSFVQSDSFLKTYGAYAVLGSVGLGLLFVLYRKWRLAHQKDEVDFD